MSNKQNAPSPIVKSTFGLSPLWVLPLLALGLAAWLVFQSINEAGQRIQILFGDAQGLEAGRTIIRYQGLEVGKVRNITLADDLDGIYVDANIYPEATQLLTSDTAFWLVKPRASITGISGLETLVSGNYIALQPGKGEPRRSFIARDEPPTDMAEKAGTTVKLHAQTLGSLNVGSPLYYRKIRVGEVYSYRLDSDAQGVTLSALIEPQFAHLLKQDTRFWSVSGLKASMDVSGIDVQIDSMASLIAGGIAFDSPDASPQSKANQPFQLYRSLAHAARGQSIKIALPSHHGLPGTGSRITYQGLEVGEITHIEMANNQQKPIATARIDPSMTWLLNKETQLRIEQPRIGFDGLKNIGNLVLGNYLSIDPGSADAEEVNDSHVFTARTWHQQQKQLADALTVTLTAEDAYGLTQHTKVLHRGIQVGFIDSVSLNKSDTVTLSLVIDPAYRHLVKQQSQFFILGGITGELTGEGLDVVVPAMEQVADPALSFTSQGPDGVQDSYPLYTSPIQAKHAKQGMHGQTRFTLVADRLPSISEGSPVMYRNFVVGHVEGYQLNGHSVSIAIAINNRYKHLINRQTVFWNQSGLDIKANLSGVEINTGSLRSLINGGIAFGKMPGISNKRQGDWKLYPSKQEAAQYGVDITLTVEQANGVKVGSAIRYQGVGVGEVINLTPDFNQERVHIQARLYPEYKASLARSGSYFWLTQPVLSLTKTENLDSLFGTYISVVPGNGEFAQQFTLHHSPKYPQGLTLILESEARHSVTAGTPVLHRDIEVGIVSNVQLGELSDRVVFELQIAPQYAHLIRENTVFWNESGVDVSIGLTGADLKSGTIDSLLKGGIAFSTPDDQPLQPVAGNKHHFLLHSERKKAWQEWRTAIPKP
ncbi:PqiB family protein [Salinivibrio sp. ES.052]|uniref:PqiB family protein n=1 Tax=Salinivibrio sp. ES.052 TaxID=1882823 RepID=UPI000929BDE2|nr:MlaD family protein [Salinivibrio sp. ES.052]SIN85474.1 Paraquat-inducible protein B [Salinivibrio sp. ES.052]